SAANITVEASYAGSRQSAAVTVSPRGSSGGGSVTITPASVPAGSYATVTVTLGDAAPAAGARGTLPSRRPAAFPLPRPYTIPAGQTSASFGVQAGTVTASTNVTVDASYAGAKQSGTVTVTPAISLRSVSISPTSVTAGAVTSFVVTLSGPAPVGGA